MDVRASSFCHMSVTTLPWQSTHDVDEMPSSMHGAAQLLQSLHVHAQGSSSSRCPARNRYHSHADEAADTYAGLMGAIVVSRRGSSRPDGTPADVDREFVMFFR